MNQIQISPNGDRYRAGNLIIRHATPADDTGLQKILKANPMAGWIRLTLERSPSYFAGENLLGTSRVVIGEDATRPGESIGMYHTTFLPVFINGEKRQAGYLGELRVNPSYRNRLSILKHGFNSIRPLNRPESDATKIWFTSLASDNHRARRLLEARHPSLPRYQPLGEIQTLAISVRQRRRPKLLQAARRADIPRLCEFYNRQASRYQFAPCLEPAWFTHLSPAQGLGIEDFWLLKNNGDIQACIALWDQRTIKQTMVQGYRFPLNILRPLVNLNMYLQGRPLLPRSGRLVESVILAFFAIAPSAEPDVLVVLREALHIATEKNAKIGLLGLSIGNPLLPRLSKALDPIIYRTCIETVSWPEEASTQLDELLVQPEIALL
ncbi:MAG: hypothetical protein QNJ78_10370 [Gammaproteobacteria bacterium]|nr:hypothetical protein [Gammaproteobacteria bacterium]